MKASNETNSSTNVDISTTSQQNESIPPQTVSNNVENAKINGDDKIAGYIFMCNTATKPECFIYRVFGLPSSRLKVVEKIKPNAKLFLFDFDVKLLYGLYVADSSGQWSLEPYAFGGKFPAQVKFSIVRDCLPLPEAAFKEAIKENYYSGSKFKQELTEEQANKLVSLFRPIDMAPVQPPPLSFLDDVRNLFQKYMEPNQLTRPAHMHHNRSVPEVPRAPYATSSNYVQNPIPPISPVSPPVGPPSSTLHSRASQLVAMAGQALNSNILPPSSEPNINHAHVYYNRPDTRTVGHEYQNQSYQNSHHASSWVGDHTSRPIIHSNEAQAHPNSVNYHTQNQTQWSLNTGVGPDRSHAYYNGPDPTTSNYYNYGYQRDPALSQSQQQSVISGVDNSHVYYDTMNSTTTATNNTTSISTTSAYDYNNQGYYSYPQPVQQVNYVPAPEGAMRQTYWTSGPHGSGYVNQVNYS